MNKKGFTLVELLAVIVILGILAAVAILSVTNILDNARKNTYVANANGAISAFRTELVANPDNTDIETSGTTQFMTLANINKLLDKTLINSPFGDTYDAANSYVQVATVGGVKVFSICMTSGSHGISGKSGTPEVFDGSALAESSLSKDYVSEGTVTCTPPTAD